jgi:two-component system, sensor histidine kinase
MPVMNGLEATAEIRRFEREHMCDNKPTVVVALTANATEEDRKLCLGSGMDDFFVKPISREGLKQLIDTWKARH